MSREGTTAEQLRIQLVDDFRSRKGFVDKLRGEVDHVWSLIDAHPFLTEIERGTLPIKKYETYATQNYFYFSEWFRSCGAAAARAATTAETLTFKSWMTETNPEYEKFMALIKQVGLTNEDLVRITTDPSIPLPGARAYVDYTYKIYSTGTAGEMAAAILPCAWTYSPRDLGGLACPFRLSKALADHYGVDREIAMDYGSYSDQKPHFQLLLSLKDTISREAERGQSEVVNRMRDIFHRCAEYEYMWWDLAYRHEPGKHRQIGAYF